jgi:hypothetical protein
VRLRDRAFIHASCKGDHALKADDLLNEAADAIEILRYLLTPLLMEKFAHDFSEMLIKPKYDA